MLFYYSNLLRIIGRTIVAALLTTIVSPTYCQESGWRNRFKTSVAESAPQVIKTAGKSFGALVSSTSANLKTKVASTISSISTKLKDSGPQAIIPMLQNALNSLGSKIGSVSSCMIGKRECSSKERAAFIGAAVVVLALTAILIGYTVTVAATSKEVDSQVVRVSQQVQGWGPEAIFARLNNVIADFKTNLDSMKTCLIRRQCSKTQKRILYGSAATIAALATIAVGVGVGSYIYAEKEKEKREQAIRLLEDIEKAPATQTTETKPTFELPDFDAIGSSLKEKLSGWQQKIKNTIPVVDTQPLKNAYEEIKILVNNGKVKTKEMATVLFTAAIEKMKDFSALLNKTFNIDLSQLSNLASAFRSNLIELTKKIKQPIGDMKTFSDQIKKVTNYFEELALNANKAFAAWESLPAARKIQAKITSPEEYLSKRDKLDTELNELTTIQKEIKQEYRSANPNDTIVVKNKFGIKSTVNRREYLNKEFLALAEKIRKLEDESQQLAQMKDFDIFFRKNTIPTIYQDMVSQINSLQIDAVGIFTNGFLTALSKLIDTAQTLNTQAGKIGAIIYEEKIDQGLYKIKYGIKGLNDNIAALIKIKPLIETERIDNLSKTILAILQGLGNSLAKYLVQNRSKIKATIGSIEAIVAESEAITFRLENFDSKLNSISDTTKKEFFEKIQSRQLAGIASAPALLLNSLSDAIGETKSTFSQMVESIAKLFEIAKEVLPDAYMLLNDFNNNIAAITDKPFINQKVFELLNSMITVNFINIDSGIKELKEGIKNIRTDLSAPAAG